MKNREDLSRELEGKSPQEIFEYICFNKPDEVSLNDYLRDYGVETLVSVLSDIPENTVILSSEQFRALADILENLSYTQADTADLLAALERVDASREDDSDEDDRFVDALDAFAGGPSDAAIFRPASLDERVVRRSFSARRSPRRAPDEQNDDGDSVDSLALPSEPGDAQSNASSESESLSVLDELIQAIFACIGNKDKIEVDVLHRLHASLPRELFVSLCECQPIEQHHQAIDFYTSRGHFLTTLSDKTGLFERIVDPYDPEDEPCRLGEILAKHAYAHRQKRTFEAGDRRSNPYYTVAFALFASKNEALAKQILEYYQDVSAVYTHLIREAFDAGFKIETVMSILNMMQAHLNKHFEGDETAVNSRFVQLFASQYDSRGQTYFEKFLIEFQDEGLHALVDVIDEPIIANIVAANVHRFKMIATKFRQREADDSSDRAVNMVSLASLMPDAQVEVAVFPQNVQQTTTLLNTLFRCSDAKNVVEFMASLNYVSHRLTKKGYRVNLFDHEANDIEALCLGISDTSEQLGVKGFLFFLRIYAYLVNLQLEGGSESRIEQSEKDFLLLIETLLSARVKKQTNGYITFQDTLLRYITAHPLPEGTSLSTLTGGWLPSNIGGYNTQMGSSRHHDLREALKGLNEAALEKGLDHFQTFLQKRSTMEIRYRRSIPDFSTGSQGVLKTKVVPAAKYAGHTAAGLFSGGSGSAQTKTQQYRLYEDASVEKLLSVREQAFLKKIHDLVYSQRLTPVPSERSQSRSASRASGRSSAMSFH